MTRDEIIRMAKEADLWMTSDERIAAVQRFAELVAAHELEQFAKQCAKHAVDIARRAVVEEREACAKVADEYTHGVRPDISAAIRARGQA